jgi:hypothetical protein
LSKSITARAAANAFTRLFLRGIMAGAEILSQYEKNSTDERFGAYKTASFLRGDDLDYCAGTIRNFA